MMTAKPTGSAGTPFVNTTTAAIILAGGMSTRMGTDKAQLPFRGRRLVDVLAERVGEVIGFSNVIISGRVEGWVSVPDERRQRGPLEGVRSVLRWLKSQERYPSRVLVMPVDMPNLESEHVERLFRDPVQTDARIFAGFELPLVLKIGPDLEALFEELCSDATPRNERSFRTLLKRITVENVSVDGVEPGVFANTNTPDEWKEVLS